MHIQGHRGCRGLIPENTIEGFIKTIELGCDGLELDVVVAKDKSLIVSHDPWMKASLCININGGVIPEKEEKTHNIYEMTPDEIALYDCGSLTQDNFPNQLNTQHYKPTLQEVFNKTLSLTPPEFTYNIEIKSEREWYGEFQPDLSEYAEIILKAIEPLKKRKQSYILQSFDTALLNKLHQLDPTESYGLLVENKKPVQSLEHLHFTPTYLNPEHILLTSDIVRQTHQAGLKIISWTVNDFSDFQRCKDLDIYGIITDYPNHFITSNKV